MTRVEWTRLSGDEVEELVAIMLLKKYDGATHIKASRGDGGIDVYLPPNGNMVEVFQVKRFSGTIGNNEKRAIRKSVEALAASHPTRRYPIGECHITLPLTPTNDADAWLAKLEGEFQLPLDWRPLAYLDGLAADYPEVVDYYCHGGRERIDTAVRSAMELLRSSLGISGSSTGGHLEAGELHQHLSNLYGEVNSIDPFYRYEFQVSAREPDMSRDEPGLVFATIERRDETGPYVTTRVFEKFLGAAEFKPVRMKVRPTLADPDQSSEWHDLHKYGLPAQVEAEFEASLPGGLSGSSAVHSGVVSVRPRSKPSSPARLERWEILSPGGDSLCEAMVRTETVSSGITGTGVSMTGVEVDGTFKVVLRFDPEAERVGVRITYPELDGRIAAEIVAGVRFLANLRPENQLRISPQFGPRSPENISLGEFDGSELPIGLLHLIENLLVVQGVTAEPIRIPQRDELVSTHVAEIRETAQLIRGETVRSTWGETPLTVTVSEPNIQAAGGPSALLLRSPKSIRIGGADVPVGTVAYEFPAVEQVGEATRRDDGQWDMNFVPALGKNFVNITLAPNTE